MNASEIDHNDLGEFVEAMSPSRANIIAGKILARLVIYVAVIMVGFIVREVWLANGNLPFNARRGMCWLAVIVGTIGAFLAIVCGVIFLSAVRSMRLTRVEWHEYGFRYHGPDSIEDVAWDDIAMIVETITRESPALLMGPIGLLLPRRTHTCYALTTFDGSEFRFDNDYGAKLQRITSILEEIHAMGSFPWKRVGP